ncbi:MAG TPA: (d)CMP kinase [Dehalococcoidia bacterium]|nr:(d)CMP kinase [Dehalococcoidia bacterium]
MLKPLPIAIDGPSGVGKSVVGRCLAQRLGYAFVDTGAMYRALTWLALDRGVDPNDQEGLSRLAAETDITITRPTMDDGRPYSVFVQGRDVTWAIRRPEVEAQVSLVSRVPGVRDALVSQQRVMAEAGGVVMVGRDIGTVVLPRAPLKVYLVASPEERAMRRFRELRERGEEVDWEALRDEMARRDKIDSERAHSPLRPAEDAHIVDTENRTVEEVVEEIERLLKSS